MNHYGWNDLLDLETFNGRRYGEYFDHEALAQIAKHMGLAPSPDIIAALRCRLFDAFQRYKGATVRQARPKSLKAENAALVSVRRRAEKLLRAIEHVQALGTCQERLSEGIKGNPTSATAHGRPTLPDILDSGYRPPFQTLNALLFDLQVSAQRAIGRAPKEITPPEPTGIGAEGRAALRAYKVDQLAQADSDRPAPEALPKDFPLLCFLNDFEKLWNALSDRPFTEGRYFKEVGQSVSATVDAVEFCMSRLHAPYGRPQMENAIRKIREKQFDFYVS